MEGWINKEGKASYSIGGTAIEICWEGRGIEKEIDLLFTPLLFTTPSCPNNTKTITLKLTATDIPESLPYFSAEPFSCYDVSIFEESGRVGLTDGYSMFQVQPHEGMGVIHLHSSFKEKPLISKYNFLLIGLSYLFSHQGFYDLHAAGLVRDGAGYLFVGESGCGKSSLAISLVHQGWQYLSDDALLLKASNCGVEAFGFRRKFSLDPVLVNHYPEIASYLEVSNSFDNRKRFLDLRSIYPDRFSPSCHPEVLIFTHIVSQHESTLIPLDKTSALIKLMKQSTSLFISRQRVSAHLQVLKQLVSQTVTFELFAGRDLFEDPQKISEILSETQVPNGIT